MEGNLHEFKGHIISHTLISHTHGGEPKDNVIFIHVHVYAYMKLCIGLLIVCFIVKDHQEGYDVVCNYTVHDN